MARSTFKILYFIKRGALRKDGTLPIIARITIDGNSSQFNTKLFIDEKMWDVSSSRVIGKTIDAISTNNILDSIKANLIKIYHHQQEFNKFISAEKIRNIFLGKSDENDTLISVFTKHNEDVLSLVGISRSKCTYDKYQIAKKRVIEFLEKRMNRKDIGLNELNLTFIQNYELFLRTECKLSNNVVAKMIQFLKKMVTMAFNNGTINSNPFANFHVKLNKVDIGFLTQKELDTIMRKNIEIERLRQVRDVFLFCCYTGLSYIDVKQLTNKNLIVDNDNRIWIATKRQKTDNKVDVPLLDIPKRILNSYKGTLPKGVLLPVLSNQKCNSYLKELADICGIDKNLTFHMSRHTFGTTVTLSNGVPIESVSKMLGHSNIKTTQLYARVTKLKIESDMSMLEEKLKTLNC